MGSHGRMTSRPSANSNRSCFLREWKWSRANASGPHFRMIINTIYTVIIKYAYFRYSSKSAPKPKGSVTSGIGAVCLLISGTSEQYMGTIMPLLANKTSSADRTPEKCRINPSGDIVERLAHSEMFKGYEQQAFSDATELPIELRHWRPGIYRWLVRRVKTAFAH
jgi:hypothetical protein